MRKILFFIYLALLSSLRLFCQDGYADSLQLLVENAGSDAVKIAGRIELAKYNYFILVNNQTPIDLTEQAIQFAQQKKLFLQQATAMYWRDYFSIGIRKSNSKELVLESLQFAREHNLKNAESDFLLLLARVIGQNKDSASMLIEQGLSIATKYVLAEQTANALIAKGGLLISSKPDTARLLFSRALAFSNAMKPEAKYYALRNISRNWTTQQQTDTAAFYMRLTLRHAEANKLLIPELTTLQLFLITEGGFFLKDSLESYYARFRKLCRENKMDSLPAMNRYVQASQDIGNFYTALETGLEALRICELRKDSADMLRVLYGIGLSYSRSLDYHKAIVYLHAAEPFGKFDGFQNIFVFDDLANAYLKLHKNDSAKYYAAHSYKAAIDYYGDEASVYGGVLNDLGAIYLQLGEDSLAYNYLQRSFHFYQVNPIEYKNYALTTGLLAGYFDKHGPADSVLYFAKISWVIAREQGFLEEVSEASNLIAKYYFNRKKPDSAYYYQQTGINAYKQLYSNENARQIQNLANAEQKRITDIETEKKIAAARYASNIKLYGLITALLVVTTIGSIIYRNNRQRQKSYELLKNQKHEIDLQKSKLETSLTELRSTQAQLIQSEKMASLGELTAGIAHEIQNPLNFVNNFSEVNRELIGELVDEIDKGNTDEVKAIANDIKANEEKINHHGKRADAIVKGMLQHSRSSTSVKESTHINALCDEYLRLAYHGLRAKDKSFNVVLKTDFDPSLEKIDIIPQDIGRVLLNLYNNAFYAVSSPPAPNGGEKAAPKHGYEPTVRVSTKKLNDKILISVQDNGSGMDPAIVDKIFQPFFTTKPTGQGTGLGLSLAYDIVKAHGGDLKVETKAQSGSIFIIQLPIYQTA